MSQVENLYSVVDGYEAFALCAEANKTSAPILFVARDDTRAQNIADVLRFLKPDANIILFPAWDCLPYDRVSPKADIVADRMDALWNLAQNSESAIVITSVAAAQQRIIPKDAFKHSSLQIRKGGTLKLDDLQNYLVRHGYNRASLVREPGEYAVRGGLIDLFAIGQDNPVRIDLFGDDVEKIQTFDAIQQTTIAAIESFELKPASEVPLDAASIEKFKSGYRRQFGNIGDKDPLYTALSEGRHYPGLEHFLPLFFDRLETLFDYAAFAEIILDHQSDLALHAQDDQIKDFYQARQSFQKQASTSGAAYNPLPPENLYLSKDEWQKRLQGFDVTQYQIFFAPDEGAVDTNAKSALGFAEIRSTEPTKLFDRVVEVILAEQKNKIVLISAYTQGSAERLKSLLREHGLPNLKQIENFTECKRGDVAIALLPIERGFTVESLSTGAKREWERLGEGVSTLALVEQPPLLTSPPLSRYAPSGGEGLLLLTEQDILGDRMTRVAKKRRSSKSITEPTALQAGEFVVHNQHGIGRFDGLETINAAGAPHDCLRLIYEGGDRLFVPVENIDVLTRYGGADSQATLDKLGGVAWQNRRARVKKRLKDMAAELMKVAAERAMKPGDVLQAPAGAFDEFAARFPYAETEDQLRVIKEIVQDLAAGQPMDRLVCGDVGFGKTEVALRAAFVAAISGVQVAVIAPTTLLCRQHFHTFTNRFKGLPVRIAQLSRFVTAKDAKQNKEEIAAGKIDIVIGTHALLSNSVQFKHLGLVIVDEEQHFGVKQKEKLKQLRADVHVLTLTATPIPRTLQLALSGVREMSLMTTPPLDRLAVRTFVLPFDPVVLREALMREHLRGGQSFVVCPRIEDLDYLQEKLREMVPEIKTVMAHGQMPPSDLENRIQAFCDGQYDLLLSTNIVESGLDIPRANTMIVHRADLFGLAQLYQLRGRIGRSKLRGYAYLTWPTQQTLNKTAEQRLKIIESLDTLGAGFTLASHDMDLRGGGNLLGEEQSGHIREVGIELFQQMLADAVADAKLGAGQEVERPDDWSPQINLGLAVLISENYVADLGLRMQLYRNLAELDSAEAVDAFAAQLIDRFGMYPPEVENLLEIMHLKILCRRTNVAKLDAGPKGAVIQFHNNVFPNVEKLMGYLQKHASNVKLRPDQKLVFTRTWESDASRLKGAKTILGDLCGLLG